MASVPTAEAFLEVCAVCPRVQESLERKQDGGL
jgi:hypothetical protein